MKKILDRYRCNSAGVLLNWQPKVRERKVYRRLRNVDLVFRSMPELHPSAEMRESNA